jgi:hypothetical protein
VAAALRNGQVEIDAAVTELRSPNAPIAQRTAAPAPVLAPVLDTSHELRAAGEGRFSAGAASLATGDDAHDHGVDDEALHDHEDHPQIAPAPASPPPPPATRRPRAP